ncbi:hypothetical protein D3C75_1199380 [compost metagenome]
MGALITFLSAKQPQTGLVTAHAVGESGGKVFAGHLPVGHQVAQHQGFLAQIEDPQTSLCGRLRVIDHGQVLGPPGAIVDGASHGAQGTF